MIEAFLVAVGLKALSFLIGACLLAFFARRASAAYRHLIWKCAIGALLVLPVVSALPVSWALPVRESALPAVLAAPAVSSASEAVAPVVVFETVSEPAVASAEPFPWVKAGIGVYGFGSFCLLAYLAMGLGAAGLAVSRGTAWSSPRLSVCSERLGIRQKVRLVLLPRIASPATLGRVIALPVEAASWSEERLDLVLLHELAHVRRGDWLLGLVGNLARAVYWPIPLVWFAVARLRRENELACDDLVLNSGARAETYASTLLEIARASGSPFLPTAAEMARRVGIEFRLRSIMNSDIPRKTVVRRVGASAFTLALAAVVVAGSARLASRKISSGEALPVIKADQVLADQGPELSFLKQLPVVGKPSFIEDYPAYSVQWVESRGKKGSKNPAWCYRIGLSEKELSKVLKASLKDRDGWEFSVVGASDTGAAGVVRQGGKGLRLFWFAAGPKDRLDDSKESALIVWVGSEPVRGFSGAGRPGERGSLRPDMSGSRTSGSVFRFRSGVTMSLDFVSRGRLEGDRWTLLGQPWWNAKGIGGKSGDLINGFTTSLSPIPPVVLGLSFNTPSKSGGLDCRISTKFGGRQYVRNVVIPSREGAGKSTTVLLYPMRQKADFGAVQVGVATGPYRLQKRIPFDASPFASDPKANVSVFWDDNPRLETRFGDGYRSVLAIDGLNPALNSIRIVAVCSDGKRIGLDTVRDGTQLSQGYNFKLKKTDSGGGDGLTLDRVVGFEIETRPYETLSLPRVPLTPPAIS